MLKRNTVTKTIIHSDRIEEVIEDIPVTIENSLSKYIDISLLIPYGEKNSVARGELFYAGIRNAVLPAIDGERPIVDSVFTKDIVRSTYNYKTESTVKLLGRVDKVINDVICETTYVYEEYKLIDGVITPNILIEVVPRYKTFYKFGYEMKSEFENMEIGEESTRPIYTSHLGNMDTFDGGMNWGKNINCIFNISRDVGEDAILISERVAKSFRFNYMDDIELSINPETTVLKNVYGEKGTYKPFPLPSENINEQGVVCVTANLEDNMLLSISDEIEKSDDIFYVFDGKVYDVQVYCNNDEILRNNKFLYDLYRINKDYIQNIVNLLSSLDMEKFDITTQYKYNKYASILQNELRVGKKDLKNNVYINIKICNEKGIGIGNKITNRHGAKGMGSDVFPDGTWVAEDGEWIDLILNASSTNNRENPAQLFEKDINGINVFFRKYLNTSKDSIDIKFTNLGKFMILLGQEELYKFLCDNYTKEDIIKYYSINDISVKSDPYGHTMTLWDFVEVVRFVESLIEVKPFTIYCNGKPLSDKHYYGKMFMFLLKNSEYHDTSIATDEFINSKGSVTKRGESKKDHRTKMNTTTAKSSNLSTTILLNSIKYQDKDLLNNNTKSIHNYMSAMGIEFSLQEKGE